MKRRRLQRHMLARLREASTWRGLILLATALGLSLEPEQEEAIVVAGLGLAGLIGVLLPDGRGGDDDAGPA